MAFNKLFSEAYLEPTGTYTIKLFVKIVNGKKGLIIDVRLGSKYASDLGVLDVR